MHARPGGKMREKKQTNKNNMRCICSQVGTFSVSSVCPGSPSLPDKAKHNREVMILLPSHRERANNSVYYNMAENGQVGRVEGRAGAWG